MCWWIWTKLSTGDHREYKTESGKGQIKTIQADFFFFWGGNALGSERRFDIVTALAVLSRPDTRESRKEKNEDQMREEWSEKMNWTRRDFKMDERTRSQALSRSFRWAMFQIMHLCGPGISQHDLGNPRRPHWDGFSLSRCFVSHLVWHKKSEILNRTSLSTRVSIM